jgi:hypothetical protein
LIYNIFLYIKEVFYLILYLDLPFRRHAIICLSDEGVQNERGRYECFNRSKRDVLSVFRPKQGVFFRGDFNRWDLLRCVVFIQEKRGLIWLSEKEA